MPHSGLLGIVVATEYSRFPIVYNAGATAIARSVVDKRSWNTKLLGAEADSGLNQDLEKDKISIFCDGIG